MTTPSFILILETACISSYTWNLPLMKITAPWTRFHQVSFPKMKELEAKYLEKFNKWIAPGPSMHNRKTKQLLDLEEKHNKTLAAGKTSWESQAWRSFPWDWKPHPCWELISSIPWEGKGKRMPSSHRTNKPPQTLPPWDSPGSICA